VTLEKNCIGNQTYLSTMLMCCVCVCVCVRACVCVPCAVDINETGEWR